MSLRTPAILPASVPATIAPAELPSAVKQVSVVLPCLNEERTIGACITKALSTLETLGFDGEVLVCDNGSTDGSAAAAAAAGARVVSEVRRGYGIALRHGIEAAQGEYVLMADSDDTYDLSQIGDFIRPLQAGADFVMGNRFGGRIHAGAMPVLNHYLGNPVLTLLLKVLFGSPFSDAQCGMRAFRRDAYHAMQLRTVGMEFASEMVISALRLGLRTAQVPIDYYPRHTYSKLRPWRDGLRHVRFIAAFCPLRLFQVPALLAGLAGLVLLFLPPATATNGDFAGHQVLGWLMLISAFQLALAGVVSKTYALLRGFEHSHRELEWFYEHFALDRGVLAGLVIGVGSIVLLTNHWPGTLESSFKLLGSALFAMASEAVFSSFTLSLLGVRIANDEPPDAAADA